MRNWRTIAGAVLAPMARELTAALPRILFYHRVGDGDARATPVAEFEAQLQYIKRHFDVVPLDAIVRARREGTPLPSHAVALTVDDGYADFAEIIYPLLQRYAVPATLFAVSQFVAGKTWLWFDRLRYVCETSCEPVLYMHGDAGAWACSLATVQAREATWGRLADYGLRLSPTRREEMIAQCAQSAHVKIPVTPPARYRAMTFDEIKALDSSLVTVGAHTRTHPILSSCSEREQAEEIVGSKYELEAGLGRSVSLFCYPNGQPCDFDLSSVNLVAEAGFSGAVTSVSALVDYRVSSLLLPRLGATAKFASFKNEINGLSELQSRLPTARKASSAPGSRPPTDPFVP